MSDAATPDSLVYMGRVLRAHGLAGEVKVLPETDDPARFEALQQVYLGASPEKATGYALKKVRYQHAKRGATVLLTLEGVAGKDQADTLRKLQVYAVENELPPLAEDEYYLHQVVGFEVVEADGTAIGTLRDVMDLPAHPVFVVSRPGLPEVMIPAVPAFIEDLDLLAERIVVKPIEGLLDD